VRLAAVLACRNKSSRLYAKPLQNLDVKNNVTILDYLVAQLKKYPEINQIVLGISETEENRVYIELAESYKIPYVLGDDCDVLSRLIKGGELVGADHLFRVTTESPYTCLDDLSEIYKHHCVNHMDYSTVKELPDGSFYEIISMDALRQSWRDGDSRHRSELCTLYIFENRDKFRIVQHEPQRELRRKDLRLTVDWPEDLIVMRKIYEDLELSPEKKHSLGKIIHYLDAHPKINSINNWIDSGTGRIWY